MTARARVIWALGWNPGIPGSERHVDRISAVRPGGSPAPDLSLVDPDEWDWQDRALCAEIDPEAWFPAKGGSMTAVKRLCARCDVRDECLEYALDSCESWGIWGGLTAPERLILLAAREPGVPRCDSGWHPLAGANLTGDGRCRACSEVRSVRIVQARHEKRELAA